VRLLRAPVIETSVGPWRDPKRHLWLLGVVMPLLPLMAAGLVALTGLGIFWWWGAIFAFIIMPILDITIGRDTSNPPEEAAAALDQDTYYRWCTYMFIPLQYVALVYSCYLWAGTSLSVIDKIGLAATMGVVAGVAINAAHELGHKRDQLERRLSKISLAQTAYGHFYVEHNRGHHVRVATPEDAASSRFGEGFWAFWPRTVVGSVASAWGIESRRFVKRGTTKWSWRNDVLTAWALTVLLWAGLLIIFGLAVLPYLVIQALVGITLLEAVNYLEHYGLLRQARGDRYVRVAPEHSWNSNNTVSNLMLYHLQRHSDHHANPARRYQSLRHMDAAPQLPGGYAAMIVLAAVPVAWRKVMDPKLVAHYDGDLTLANIAPRKRKKILAKYANAK
jgi:alkane 1-monooxygenase